MSVGRRLRPLVSRWLATPGYLRSLSVPDVSAAHARLDQLQESIKETETTIVRLGQQIAIIERSLKSPGQRYGPLQETDLLTSSFASAAHARLRDYRVDVSATEGFRDPGHDFDSKLEVRRFATLHGLPVAEMKGPWPRPEDIPFDDLPESFVVKGSLGAGAVAVFPLVKSNDGLLDLIGDRVVTRDEIIAALMVKHRAESRYFVEEMLTAPGTRELPFDVKVFCCYGEPAWLEVRRGAWTRSTGPKPSLRLFTTEGAPLDLGRPLLEQDAGIRPPQDLSTLMEWCRRLSTAILSPLVRLDFYDTDRGLVFGEVTPFPGRAPNHSPELDKQFGEVFEAGHARLLQDLVSEGVMGPRRG